MKYIIADTDEKNCIELKKILDGYEMLDFQGSFSTIQASENHIRRAPPDMAFIRIGEAKLNAFKLATVIRELSPPAKVIFLSRQITYAVEAFEWEADDFLLLPLDAEKIRKLLLRSIG